jgi:hypothetical protein
MRSAILLIVWIEHLGRLLADDASSLLAADRLLIIFLLLYL